MSLQIIENEIVFLQNDASKKLFLKLEKIQCSVCSVECWVRLIIELSELGVGLGWSSVSQPITEKVLQIIKKLYEPEEIPTLLILKLVAFNSIFQT